MKTAHPLFLRILAIALLTFPLLSYAQVNEDSRIGIKAGVNLSNFYSSEIDDQNARIGFNAGIFTELALNDLVSVQPELLFSTRGNQRTYGDDGGVADDFDIEGDVRFNLFYVDLPILLKLSLADVINIHAGPYISYLLGANITTEGDLIPDGTEDLDRDNFNTWDFGLAVGLGLDLNAVTIGLRYNLGLNEIANSTEADLLLDDVKNSLLQAYVAVGL
uniref:Porin family protein n=1 Tax=Roseihalotalea indica TaxID=2867963 RepID=A0AA49GNN8_9BACT|nr:porin family protein [Tunicatimonas sp. TK19036]